MHASRAHARRDGVRCAGSLGLESGMLDLEELSAMLASQSGDSPVRSIVCGEGWCPVCAAGSNRACLT